MDFKKYTEHELIELLSNDAEYFSNYTINDLHDLRMACNMTLRGSNYICSQRLIENIVCRNICTVWPKFYKAKYNFHAHCFDCDIPETEGIYKCTYCWCYNPYPTYEILPLKKKADEESISYFKIFIIVCLIILIGCIVDKL